MLLWNKWGAEVRYYTVFTAAHHQGRIRHFGFNFGVLILYSYSRCLCLIKRMKPIPLHLSDCWIWTLFSEVCACERRKSLDALKGQYCSVQLQLMGAWWLTQAGCWVSCYVITEGVFISYVHMHLSNNTDNKHTGSSWFHLNVTLILSKCWLNLIFFLCFSFISQMINKMKT